jgi:hypothetical protein
VKKITILSASFVFLFIVALCAQDRTVTFNKKITSSVQKPDDINLIRSILPGDNSSTSVGKAPQGYYRYTRTVYIISAAELAAAGVPKGVTFTSLGFNYVLAQKVATTGLVKIYLQNSTDAAFAKTNMIWSDSVSGIIDNMTLVHNDSVTIPAATGPLDITLSKGKAFTYTGGALYVAFDYQNASGTKSPSVNSASCTSVLVGGGNGLRNAYSSTVLPTALNYTSVLRPETRAKWITGINNDAKVAYFYSYGELPVNGLAVGNPFSAVIVNNGDTTLTNLNVTLSVTGANTYTNTQVIPSLTEGSSATVSFAAFSPTAVGANTVTISVPSDGDNTNNSLSSSLTTTSGTIGYLDNSSLTGSLGLGAANAGIFLARYYVTGSATIKSTGVIIGASSANVGQSVYGVLVDTSGVILDSSSYHTILATDLGATVTFNFPNAKKVSNQYIFVGLAEPKSNNGADFYPLGIQSESPTRANAYYYTDITGGVPANVTTYNRFPIEASFAVQTTPVELTSFTSNAKNGIVTLKWSTATETNNSGYDIERSIAANTWVKVGSVNGNNTTSKISNYSFVDDASKLGAVSINYRIKQIDLDGSSKYYYLSSAVQISAPKSFELSQNYPNPFNPNTSIRYNIPKDSKVKIEVYDALGRTVASLVNEYKSAGSYSVNFDASSLASGVYLYKISAGDFTATKKMNLLK